MTVVLRCGFRASCVCGRTSLRRTRIRWSECGKFMRRNLRARKSETGKEQFSATVLVVFLFALPHWDNTSVGHFTHCMFKLNRGVVDAEVSMQAFLYIPQDALANRGGNVGNRDVAREGASFRADAPTVKVVHVVDAVDGADGGLDQFKLHAAGRALEQDVEGFADDAEA